MMNIADNAYYRPFRIIRPHNFSDRILSRK